MAWIDYAMLFAKSVTYVLVLSVTYVLVLFCYLCRGTVYTQWGGMRGSLALTSAVIA